MEQLLGDSKGDRMGIQMDSMKGDLKDLLKGRMMVVHWGYAMD